MRIQRLKDKTLWIAAANDQEVDTVIISAGTWSKCFVEKTERKSVLMERNCDDCIFAQRSGGCVAWNCEPIPIRGAEKAWKEKNAPTPLTIEERTAKSIATATQRWKGARTMRLIDADALIAEMHNIILEDGEDRRIFYEVIERQPTIDPVKRGRWIHEGPRHRGGVDWMHCSECGNTDVFGAKNMYHYCPNCGAKMDEVTE